MIVNFRKNSNFYTTKYRQNAKEELPGWTKQSFFKDIQLITK